jgi:hypothetical protein
MAEQTGIPAHRFLHPVGRGEHYSRRADFDEADAFYSDSYQLHEPPSIELRPHFPNRTTEAANALRKADEGLKSALGDLCDLLP